MLIIMRSICSRCTNSPKLNDQSRYAAGGSYVGTTVTTQFDKIKLNPYSLIVDSCSYKYASPLPPNNPGSIVFGNQAPITQVQYLLWCT